MNEKPFPLPTYVNEIINNSPPSIPNNPTPFDRADNVVRTVILHWQSTDPDSQKLYFDVYFNIDSVFDFQNIIAEDYEQKLFELPSQLLANTTYYWKVDVHDESGNWQFGPLWRFKTGTEVNNAPVITILSPVNNAQFNKNDSIVFKGRATDIEDGVLSGSALQWSSNINGVIGSDSVVATSSLSAGFHLITLKAADSQGKSASASIIVKVIDAAVQNNTPSAAILAPQNGASFGEDRAVTFRGIGLDIEDGILHGSAINWASSLNGAMGIDTLLVISHLSKGSHTITMRATDTGGKFAEKQIQITITQVYNNPPMVAILSPTHLTPYAVDSVILFSASASDIEDGPLTDTSVTWSSNRDGTIGTGTQFTRSGLSIGVHNITVRAQDSQGAANTDLVTITITPLGAANNAPVVTIVQPADNAILTQGSAIAFQGTVTDQEDGTIRSTYWQWSSDRDGYLGSGTSLTKTNLSSGKHIITLKAVDSGRKEGSHSITIFIGRANNTAPSARFIVQQAFPPANPSTVNITLDASNIYDAEDVLSAIEVRWDYDNDGIYDTPFTYTKTASYSYTRGAAPHYVKLLTRDPGGLTSQEALIVPEYIYIPAGNFYMGSGTGNPADEQPRQTVSVSAFYIDRFEVTNSQYAAFLTDNENTAYYSNQMAIDKLPDNSYIAKAGFENYPIRYVDWSAANAYAQWNNKRLPTETEWEKTARGGLYLDEANAISNPNPTRVYSWANEILSLQYANYLIVGRPFDGIAPVGTYNGQLINSVQTISNASPYGVFDLLGNAAEWVSDWYQADYYSVSPSLNPTGPETGQYKVYKGGSFDNTASEIYISKRFSALPTARPYNVGFRTVRTP